MNRKTLKTLTRCTKLHDEKLSAKILSKSVEKFGMICVKKKIVHEAPFSHDTATKRKTRTTCAKSHDEKHSFIQLSPEIWEELRSNTMYGHVRTDGEDGANYFFLRK